MSCWSWRSLLLDRGDQPGPGAQLPLAARRGLRGRPDQPAGRARAGAARAARSVRPGRRTPRTGSTTRPSTTAGTTSTSARRRRRSSSCLFGPSASTSPTNGRLRCSRLGGFVLGAALLLFLIARYAPRTPTAWRLAAVAALGLGQRRALHAARPGRLRDGHRGGPVLPDGRGAPAGRRGAARAALAPADRRSAAWRWGSRSPRARTWPSPPRCSSGRGGGPLGRARAGGGRPLCAPRRRRRPASPPACCCSPSTTSCASARRPSSARGISSPGSTRGSSISSRWTGCCQARWFYLLQPPSHRPRLPVHHTRPEYPGTLPDGLLRGAGGRGARR